MQSILAVELTELMFCALLDIILFQVRLLKAHLWFQFLDLQGVLELIELMFCALLYIILFQVRLLKAHLWFQSRPS